MRYERVDDFHAYSVQLAGSQRLGASLTVHPSFFVNRRHELTNGYDNVIQLFAEEDDQQGRPCFRVLKSMGNDYRTDTVPLEWRKT